MIQAIIISIGLIAAVLLYNKGQMDDLKYTVTIEEARQGRIDICFQEAQKNIKTHLSQMLENPKVLQQVGTEAFKRAEDFMTQASYPTYDQCLRRYSK